MLKISATKVRQGTGDSCESIPGGHDQDMAAAVAAGRGAGGRGRAWGRVAHTAVMIHWLLVLAFGVHICTAEPTVVVPAPSSAVPVPRLMIW
jgi:hypothetical protein